MKHPDFSGPVVLFLNEPPLTVRIERALLCGGAAQSNLETVRDIYRELQIAYGLAVLRRSLRHLHAGSP